jgi:hypothetical protein
VGWKEHTPIIDTLEVGFARCVALPTPLAFIGPTNAHRLSRFYGGAIALGNAVGPGELAALTCSRRRFAGELFLVTVQVLQAERTFAVAALILA